MFLPDFFNGLCVYMYMNLCIYIKICVCLTHDNVPFTVDQPRMPQYKEFVKRYNCIDEQEPPDPGT